MAGTKALCCIDAPGKGSVTEEPVALLLSDTLTSSYKWEHDAHMSDAVLAE